MKTKTAKTKKVVAAKKATAKKVVGKDHFGFRIGTNVSNLFAALLNGASMEDLKAIAGVVTSKTIAEFKLNPKKNPRGRSAVVEVSDKGIYKITKHTAPVAE